MSLLANPSINCLIVLLSLILQADCIYKDPPAYFNSFYCNLGTKNMADSGDYSCTAPKLIQRADKFALALVQLNKVPSAHVNFRAQITSSPGVNIGSVSIHLEFKSSYTTKYGYMVVVVGYQTENSWLDLVTVKLPVNPADPEVILSTVITPYKSLTVQTALPSRTTTWNIASAFLASPFITSYATEPINPGTSAYLIFQLPLTTSTDVSITIRTNQNQILRQIIYSIMIWSVLDMPITVSLPMPITQMLLVDGVMTTTFSYNLKTIHFLYGPSFNQKCLILLKLINYESEFTFELVNTTLNNYNEVKLSSTAQTSSAFQFWCLFDPLTSTNGDFEFLDELTGQVYSSGNLCPIPTVDLIAPYLCKKCTQAQCIDCNPLDRTQCTLCNPTLLTVIDLSSGQCVCSNWTVRASPTSVCEPCIPYCLTCVTSNCLSCIVGYSPSLTGLQCVSCLSLLPNCTYCTSYATGCLACQIGFGVSLLGKCVNCSTLFANCQYCNTQSFGCSICVQGYGISRLTTCVACSQIFPNCKLCTGYFHNCTACLTGYTLTASGQCQASSNPQTGQNSALSAQSSTDKTTIIVLGVFLAISLFALFICLLCCCCCLRRNQVQNTVINQGSMQNLNTQTQPIQPNAQTMKQPHQTINQSQISLGNEHENTQQKHNNEHSSNTKLVEESNIHNDITVEILD